MRGFTILELLVVMTLFAILAFIGLPSLSELSDSMNRANARSYLHQDLKRAQAETITQGCRGIVKIAPDGASYYFGCDYLDYDTAASPTPDKLIFTRYLPNRITVSSSGPVILNSRGQTVDINDIMTSLTLTLYESSQQFAQGTLTGTGVYSY